MNSTLFHWSEVNGNPDIFYATLQRETCQLISKYCQQFGLDEDIEFTCFELTHKHFKNVQTKIIAECQCFDGSPNTEHEIEHNLNEYISQSLFAIKNDLPLNLFAIISITAKYFGSKNYHDLFKMLPKMLQATGRIVSFSELYHTEFQIFRNLDFCIKRSAPYQTIQTILEHCSNHINSSIYQLHTMCITLLRFTYIERHNIYKKAHAMNLPAENYIINATFIASAVVFATAIYEKFNDLYTEDLLELIKVRTGFSDNILRNFSHAILYEFNRK